MANAPWIGKDGSIAMAELGDIYVVHHARSSSDEVWTEMLQQLEPFAAAGKNKILVNVAEQAHLPVTQRAQLSAQRKSKDLRVAVLTRSLIARAGALALRWVMPSLKVLGPDDLAGALSHLGVDEKKLDEFRQHLAMLARAMR